MLWLAFSVVAVVSYLLGSLNSSIIVSHFYAKDDVRKHGSGNAGMTNTLRTYGIKPAIYTALGDCLKGVLAVVLARYLIFPVLFSLPYRGDPFGLDVGYVAGFFALVGHVYPLYFKFKGGKGVMATVGITLIIDPIVCLIILAIVLPIIVKTKYISLGSILGALLLPVLTALMRLVTGAPVWTDTICALLIGLFVLVLHRSNIQRLLNGTENRFTPPSKRKEIT